MWERFQNRNSGFQAAGRVNILSSLEWRVLACPIPATNQSMSCYVRPWCINRDREPCPCDNCEALEPETLHDWEQFALLPFREWCKLSSGERGAVLYLAVHYLLQR